MFEKWVKMNIKTTSKKRIKSIRIQKFKISQCQLLTKDPKNFIRIPEQRFCSTCPAVRLTSQSFKHVGY